MATTVASLIQRVRRRCGDWPEIDVLGASITSSGATVTVSDTASPRYWKNQRIEIGYETLLVDAVASSTTLTVFRGVHGSTAASYPSGQTVLVQPAFMSMEILDGINDGLDNLWPFFYQDVIDTSLTGDGETYEFTVPSLTTPAIVLPRLHTVELRQSGLTEYVQTRSFEILRGATPKIKFWFPPPASCNIRLRGYGPLPHVTTADSTHAQLPYMADDLAVNWAVGQLLLSGEARRVRRDTGVIDQREQANRVGASLAASRDWRGTFYQQRSDLAMSPMSRHVILGL